MTRGGRQMAAALLAVSMLGVAGCDSGGQKDEPVSPTSSASPTSPRSPATGEPDGPPNGWEDKYTADELRAYGTALSRWQRYQQLTEPIDETGKYTPEAEEVYREYVVTWQTSVIQLRNAEKAGVHVEVPPEPLWTIAESVELKADGSGTVVIRQCTDYSKVRVTKNGAVVEDGVKPQHVVTPILIRMVTIGGKWKYVETTVEDKKTCAG